jgi:glycosyltransferase involved in cell wall biosynthesis
VFSHYTGFDVALGETLSLGCATIVSNIPTIKGLLTHRKDCMIVDAHDVVGLAKTILEIVENEELRMSLSNNARAIACCKLDWRVLAKKLSHRLEGLVYSAR